MYLLIFVEFDPDLNQREKEYHCLSGGISCAMWLLPGVYELNECRDKQLTVHFFGLTGNFFAFYHE